MVEKEIPGIEDNAGQLIEKEKNIEGAITKDPDAIFILSGGIVAKDEGRTQQFKSPSYKEKDENGLITGGKARVIAAAEISKKFPEAKIITTSKDARESGRPTHAEVMAEELQKLGIHPETIIKEEKSKDTLTELREMIKMIQQNNWKNVDVITNEYHISRVEAMLDVLLSETEKEKPLIQLISAEKILETKSSHYKKLFDKVRQTDGYRLRIEREQKGVEDFKQGIYRKA